jgi:ubiquinone/menaquinone biosynthesis C-methylase UbiE
LRQRDVLEVGCGRGGGSSFVQRYHQPRSVTGVDFSAKAVRFCERNHAVEGLSFVHGDAEALPFADGSFDAVINVESSHCYGSMSAFLGQVRRVLRPGGHFLFADLRAAGELEQLRQELEACGLQIIEQDDVTPNVVEALRQDSERKLALIQHMVDKRLVNTFKQFAAIEGSEVFDNFRDRKFIYLRYVLQKQN